jgi:GNAT superfamily N-acetyltransferase
VDSAIRIRAFQPTDAEYAAVARLNAIASPEERQDFEPRSPDELRAFDTSFDPARHVLRRLVAEDVSTGGIVGSAHGFHTPWAFDPGRFWCAVRCDPAHRRRGLGGRLVAEIMSELARHGARTVWMMASEAAPELIAVLERRGFREVLRSWDFERELAPPGPAAPPAREPASGIAIEALPAAQARDSGWLAGVHALYTQVMRDVPLPGVLRADAPPAWLAERIERWSASLPEACQLAREGGRYVGLSLLRPSEEDPGTLEQLLTGVAATHRGRGIGRALKLATIAVGMRYGYRRIRTAVESNNRGMLALNEALGFVRTGGLVLLEAAVQSRRVRG